MSTASLATSCLYCRLRGPLVITPLTESSTRSGVLLSLLLLCSSPTQQPDGSYGCRDIFRDMLENLVTGSVYRHVNTCPPTQTHAGKLIQKQALLLDFYITLHVWHDSFYLLVRTFSPGNARQQWVPINFCILILMLFLTLNSWLWK